MYYEEKIINGVLMSRNTPSEKWSQVSIEKLSRDYLYLLEQNKKLCLIIKNGLGENDMHQDSIRENT